MDSAQARETGILPKLKRRTSEYFSNFDAPPFANTGAPDAPDLVRWGGTPGVRAGHPTTNAH